MHIGIDYIGVGVGAMIFNEEGKLFMSLRGEKARNQQGLWEFPGGKVEFGDTVEETIIREVKEECDFDIELLFLLEMINDILPEEKQHWVSSSFVAQYVSGTPKICEPEKCSGIRWIRLEDVNPEELTQASRMNFTTYTQRFGFEPPKS